MKKLFVCWMALVAIACVARAADDAKKDEAKQEAKAQTPQEKFSAIADEYKKTQSEYLTELRQAKTAEERVSVAKKAPKVTEFADRMIKLADEHPADDAAAEALTWVLTTVRSGPQNDKAMERIAKDFLQSSKIAAACQALGQSNQPSARSFLKAVLEKNKHAEVLGRAVLALAGSLKNQVSLHGYLDGLDAATLERMEKSYGAEYVAATKALDVTQVNQEIEQLYERVEKDVQISAVLAYPTAPAPHNTKTLGELAGRTLFEIRHLAIGKTAPEIEAEDIEGVKFKLSDYRGKVVVLDFWGDW